MIVLVLAWVLTGLLGLAVLFALAASSGQDPAGRGMLSGMATAAGLYWAVGVLPALLVLRRSNRVGLALTLLVAPILLLILVGIYS